MIPVSADELEAMLRMGDVIEDHYYYFDEMDCEAVKVINGEAQEWDDPAALSIWEAWEQLVDSGRAHEEIIEDLDDHRIVDKRLVLND